MCQMHHHWAITILNNHQLRQYGAVLLVVMGLATLPVLLGHQARACRAVICLTSHMGVGPHFMQPACCTECYVGRVPGTFLGYR